MKAVYYPTNFVNGEQVTITQQSAHHLLQVCRLQKSESLRLLDGKGRRAVAQVVAIQKKSITVEIGPVEVLPPPLTSEILIFPPQKEYFVQMLRTACELGTARIWVSTSDFIAKYSRDQTDRWEKILISALEQSQGAHLPSLEFISWEQFPHSDFDKIWIFGSEQHCSGISSGLEFPGPGRTRTLIGIGPEGGFSPRDYAAFISVPQVQIMHLPCPILRAVSALPVAWGWVLGQQHLAKKT